MNSSGKEINCGLCLLFGTTISQNVSAAICERNMTIAKGKKVICLIRAGPEGRIETSRPKNEKRESRKCKKWFFRANLT